MFLGRPIGLDMIYSDGIYTHCARSRKPLLVYNTVYNNGIRPAIHSIDRKAT